MQSPVEPPVDADEMPGNLVSYVRKVAWLVDYRLVIAGGSGDNGKLEKAMNLRHIRTLAFFVAVGALAAAHRAHAAEPTVKQCLAASEASLKLGNEYKLRAERTQLLICASSSCPTDVRKECLRRVDDVNLAIPTIVFEVKDAAGNDLTAVSVTMDGERLIDKLQGVALPIDPGEHTFRFEVVGQLAIEKHYVIRESQKERHESIVFSEPKGASTNAKSSPETDSGNTAARQGNIKEPAEAPPKAALVPATDHSSVSNLISLAIQQDYLYHSDASNVCSPSSSYECYQGSGARVLAEDSATVHTQVLGSGFSSGTLRLLAGYDRFLNSHVSIGLRAGAVLSGKPTQTAGDAPFMFFHAEGRVAYWLGREPLGSSFNPYLFASVGAAEVDIRVQLRYQDPAVDCSDCRLNGWRRAGFEFVGAGLGLIAVVAANSGPLLEARYVQYVGKSGSSVAGQLGYTLGF